MPLRSELASTLRAIQGLKAQRQDDLEDYFHDAIELVLSDGKTLDNWLPYLYKSVSRRIAFGNEGRVHLPLEESILPSERPPNLDLEIDIRKAILTLSDKQQQYIYEYFYEGFTLDEIAMLHDVTNQAVSKTIQRGLDVMRILLRG